MQITNQYSEKVFWRAFRGEDNIYAIGLKEGALDQGNRDQWIDTSFPEIKVEVKSGGAPFHAKTLVPAGPKFKMTDNLLVTATGQLVVG